jgi:hypothetical protein
VFKRLFWMTVGMAIGFGTSFWIFRTVRETLSRYAPEQIAENVGSTARRLFDDLAAAAAEGREAMRQAEAELRAVHRPS